MSDDRYNPITGEDHMAYQRERIADLTRDLAAAREQVDRAEQNAADRLGEVHQLKSDLRDAREQVGALREAQSALLACFHATHGVRFEDVGGTKTRVRTVAFEDCTATVCKAARDAGFSATAPTEGSETK